MLFLNIYKKTNIKKSWQTEIEKKFILNLQKSYKKNEKIGGLVMKFVNRELTLYLCECQRNKLDKNIEKARMEYSRWKVLASSLETIMAWERNGFVPEQFKEWTEIGLRFNDYRFAVYLTEQDYEPQNNLNLKELRREYNKTTQGWLDKNYPNK